MRSPVNQVFQFTGSGEFTGWADGTKTSATSYLWIPENCRKLRGLLILCSNVPEHMLVGHPAIRAVCAANDLGIVFFPKSFYNFKSKNTDPNQTAALQQILDGLAKPLVTRRSPRCRGCPSVSQGICSWWTRSWKPRPTAASRESG